MSTSRDSQAGAILSAVLETTDDLICAVDVETYSLLIFNSAFARHFLSKFGKALQVGSPLDVALDAKSAAIWRANFRRAIDEGPFSVAQRGLSQGQTFWLSFNRLVKDGQCFGISVFARDISSFELASHAIQNAEDRFAKVFRQNPCALGISRVDGGVLLDVNDAFAQLLGYERSFLIGKTTLEAGIWPHTQARELFVEAMRAKGRITGMVVPCLRRDGHILQGLVACDTIQLDGDECFLTSLTDVTPLHDAEQALRESELRYRALIDMAPEAIVLIDADTGTYVDANENACRQAGFTKAEFLGLDPTHISPVNQPDGAASAALVREHIQRAARGETMVLEWLHVMRDGSSIPCEVRLTPFPDSKRRLVRGSIIDISERKHLEQQALALRAQLEQAQRMESLGTLAGGIAHDFNNILCSIIGYAELALNQTKGEPVRSFIQDIEQGANRAKDLVKQILAFSRQAPHEKKPVQVASIVTEAVKLLRVALPSTILFEQEYVSAGWVMCDPVQIHQIMMNLGTNAGLAMREKGGLLTVKIAERDIDQKEASRHLGLKPGHHLCWTVKDTGCGISSEIIGRIFEPFFTTRPQGGGTGLGLSVVYGIVTDAGGSIGVSSEVGKGTTFEILLPLCPSAEKEDPPPAPLVPSGKQRVLLVDDERSLTDLGKVTLGHFGYQVTAFNDPTEALATFRQRPGDFDVLVSDVTMPKLTGHMLASIVKQIRPDLPVVLMSGAAERLGEQGLREAGVNRFLQKPYRPTELAQAIAAVCSNYSPRPLRS